MFGEMWALVAIWLCNDNWVKCSPDFMKAPTFGNTTTATGQEEDYRLRLYSSLSLERTEVEVESWDKNGSEAFVSKQSSRYSRATISINKALKIASSCIRLKFARGNASVLASSLAEIRQRPASFIRIVEVLLLQGYCHYQRKELDNATGFFQLILFQWVQG